MLSEYKGKVLDWLGLEVQRSATLANFLGSRRIDLVVDAGANLGQFAQSIRQKGYRGRIHSIEPISQIYSALKVLADRDPRWMVTKTALGAEIGSAELNVFDNHSLSSFLRPGELLADYDTGGSMHTETVPVETLDHLLADDPAEHIFLKADVQGFEKQVLEGAHETLSRTVALYLELPVRHLYEGMWSFREAINYIDDLGFEPAQFRMVNAHPSDPASAVEFDSLFRRKGLAKQKR